MTHERMESERSGKEEVIDALRADPENLAPLLEWLAAREARCRNGIDDLLLALDKIDICLSTGFLDEAEDDIDAALDRAVQERGNADPELARRAEGILDALAERRARLEEM